MSIDKINHINRGAVAMFTGVIVWLVYMLEGSSFLHLMHPEFLDDMPIHKFVADNIIMKYIAEACQVILFLIATNTIVEVMNNNGVFDPLNKWLRMRSGKRFLWALSMLTFIVSANVDNLTTVVLMMTIMCKIVTNHHQKVIYACTILVAANLGGAFTVIGDMTSLMLWVRGVVTPSAFAASISFLLSPHCVCSICSCPLCSRGMLRHRQPSICSEEMIPRFHHGKPSRCLS